MKIDGIAQGRPSWVELQTTDGKDAVRFYTGLLGWDDEVTPLPGGSEYHSETIEGARVAGIYEQDADDRSRGIPPHWNVYLAVDSAEATAGRAEAAGGQVAMPPMDVMELGRMAFLSDPTGAMVGLWEAKTHKGFGVIQEPGAVSWCELMTDDEERAAEFYTAILDVPTKPMPMGEGAHPYLLLGPDGNEGAGIMKKTPEMDPMPNVWGVYFEVADCDATAAKAQELGGSILNPPTDIQPGRFAMIADPQGVVVGVIKSNPMAM